jgi:hypothetical protein
MKIVESNICTAVHGQFVITLGSKVEYGYSHAFMRHLEEAIEQHDAAKDRIPGQHYITMPPESYHMVSCGVGPRTPDEGAYIIRVYRGQVGLYLKRGYAAKTEGLACVVYTREAYLNDPDVVNDIYEIARIDSYGYGPGMGVTHVLVAVLASAGPKSPLPGHTLLRNLAGANHEAQVWSADEIRAKARESIEYWEKWAVVAD